jgi:hypothetical protein
MQTPTLSSPPLETLRERVQEVIQRHWVTPRPSQLQEPRSIAASDEPARAALDTMLTRQFRVGPLPPQPVYDGLLERIRRCVCRGQPIRVTVGYGPLKNQNGVSYSRADWAEFFALCHLVAWHNKVQAVYPPGLSIRIVYDDSTLVVANRADRGLMQSYMSSIGSLIEALGFDNVFAPPFGQSSFAWLFHFGLYPFAGWIVRRWERNPANFEHLERMTESARRNIGLPSGLSDEQREKAIRAAGHRYRVYWTALQLSGLSNSKSRLIAMYLDGSQHHIRQPVALHLTTLDKGQVTQPWQGEGALLDNGHRKLEPFVLTAGRRRRHRTQTLDGLKLVPHSGFEQITVAWPSAEEGTNHGSQLSVAPATVPSV